MVKVGEILTDSLERRSNQIYNNSKATSKNKKGTQKPSLRKQGPRKQGPRKQGPHSVP